MASTRALYCHTCKSDESHRSLTREEREALQVRLARRNVDEFIVCEAPDCLHVRTGWAQCAGSGGLHLRLGG